MTSGPWRTRWWCTFVTSGRGDEHQGAEWIHKAYRFSQQSQHRNPLLGLVDPAGTPAAGTGRTLLTAFESLLDRRGPLGTRHGPAGTSARCGSCFGHGGREAEAHLEMALAEFRALGERCGISFALSELADRLAMRGEFAGAVRVLRTGDRGRHRGRCHRGCHPRCGPDRPCCTGCNGDRDVERGRHRRGRAVAPNGVTWPYALVELALAKAELARWSGDAEEARHQLGVATTHAGR